MISSSSRLETVLQARRDIPVGTDVNPLLGITLKVLSALAFTVMSAGIKWVGGDYPTGQIVFFRSAFALLPLLLWLTWRGGLVASIRTSNLSGHILRGLIGSCGMFAGFLSLSYLPLSEAVAIGYAAPLFTVALSAIFLGEAIRIYRWSAVGIGFAGVLIMLLPGIGLGGHPGAALGAGFALFGAACAAVSTIQVRRLTATERTGALVLYFSLLTTALGLTTIVLGWKLPNLQELAILVAIGILGGIGQILLTQSYRYADASLVAPFDYTTMIWALPIGYLLWGQLPDRFVLVGGVLVAAAGVFVIWRERQLGVLRKRQVESGARGPV